MKSSSISLKLSFCSIERIIHCNTGNQNILWLISTCKYIYTKEFNIINKKDDLICYDVIYKNISLLPFYIINQYCNDGDEIKIIFNKINNNYIYNNNLPLWELFARTDPKDYQPIIFTLDLSKYKVYDIENYDFYDENNDVPIITGNFISWNGGLELSSANSSLASCYPSKMISSFKKPYSYKLETLISTKEFKRIISPKPEEAKVEKTVVSPKNDPKKRQSFSRNTPIKTKITTAIAINKKTVESYSNSISDDVKPGDIIESYFPLIPISNASIEEIKIVSAAVAIQKHWRGFSLRKHTISSALKVVNSDRDEILFSELGLSPRNNSTIRSPHTNSTIRSPRQKPISKVELDNKTTKSANYFRSSSQLSFKSDSQISNRNFNNTPSIAENYEVKPLSLESSILKNTATSLVFKNSLVPEGSTPKKWQLITALPASAILYFCFYYRGIQILSTDYEIVPNPNIDGNRTHVNYLQVSQPDQSFDYSGFQLPALTNLLKNKIPLPIFLKNQLFQDISFPDEPSKIVFDDIIVNDASEMKLESFMQSSSANSILLAIQYHFPYLYSLSTFLVCLDAAKKNDERLHPAVETVADNEPTPLFPQISTSFIKVSKKMSFNARGSVTTRKNTIAKANNSVANVAIQALAQNSLSKSSSSTKLLNTQPIIAPAAPDKYIKEIYKFTHNECLWMWSKCNFEVLFAKLSYQNEKLTLSHLNNNQRGNSTNTKSSFLSFASNYANDLFNTAGLKYDDVFPSRAWVSRVDLIRSIVCVSIGVAPAFQPVQAFNQFMSDCLLPYIKSFNYILRPILKGNLIKSAFSQYLQPLRKVFIHYSTRSLVEGQSLSEKSTISFVEFLELAKEFKMCNIRNISFFKKNDYSEDQLLALIFGNSLDVTNDSWKTNLSLTWNEFLLTQCTFALFNSVPVGTIASNEPFMFPPAYILQGLTDIILASHLSVYFDSIEWPDKDSLEKSYKMPPKADFIQNLKKFDDLILNDKPNSFSFKSLDDDDFEYIKPKKVSRPITAPASRKDFLNLNKGFKFELENTSSYMPDNPLYELLKSKISNDVKEQIKLRPSTARPAPVNHNHVNPSNINLSNPLKGLSTTADRSDYLKSTLFRKTSLSQFK